MSGRLAALAAALLLTSCAASEVDAPADESATAGTTREEILRRITALQKIATPNGIDRVEEIEIDGSRQWLSIRGLDRDHPVLLMIHGGPGVPVMPTRWAFQRPLEDFFTVVQWDQRGVGKNYDAADNDALASGMTIERHVEDSVAVVDHLRQSLEKDKVFVVGFSWGTHVGLLLAKRKPEWLHAYVGVGQSTPEDAAPELRGVEGYIFDRLLELAGEDGNDEAVTELESIAPYPAPGGSSLDDILTVRKWARFYDGGWFGHPDFELLWQLNDWSPEYSEADLEGFFLGARWAGELLVPGLEQSTFADFEGRYETPIFFLMGRHDLHTPYEPAKVFFDRLDAEQKRFVTFENSAHFPMFAEQGRFTKTLVDELYGVLEIEP